MKTYTYVVQRAWHPIEFTVLNEWPLKRPQLIRDNFSARSRLVKRTNNKVNPLCGDRIPPSLYQWKALTLTICTTGSSPSGFKRPLRLPKCGLRGTARNTLPMLLAPAWGGHLYPHTKTMCLKIPYIEKFILRQHQLLTDLKIYPTH